MSRRKDFPTYRLHRQSGQAVVTLTDPSGRRRDVLLGAHDSPESRAAYDRVIAEWAAAGRRLAGPPAGGASPATRSVNEVLAAFWDHAEAHYRHPDGTPTRELADFKLSLRPLKHLYGDSPAGGFGPLALKAVRQLLIDGYEHPRYGTQPPLSRGVVNQRIGRIRRVFRWAVEQEMVPPAACQGLAAVRGLARGRCAARETEPVRPVAEGVVRETQPFLNRHVRGMVEVQLLTGARPGEVCALRSCDIDTSGGIWLYRPGSDGGPHGRHKTAHHGHQRVIAIGPRAQQVVREFLTLDTRAYLFSPRRAVEELRAEKRRQRKTRVQPSQQDRRKRNPKRHPGQRYTTAAYGHAVRVAVAAANTARACAACKGLKPAERCARCRAAALPHWHPHQLRHTAATRIRREYGLDVARVVLGHRSPQITELYAELDTARAAEVMAKLG
jgi:integrase